MKILLINQYFWPDVAATGQLLADLAEDLAARGWEVRVLTSRSRYVPRPGTPPLQKRELWRGVEIHRVWCSGFGRSSTLGRLADYATFLFGAARRVLLGRRNRVTVCLSTPPFVALLGLVARWRGSRFVYKVEDLYPDVAVVLGKLRAGSLTERVLGRLSRFLLSRADRVVALDEAMARTLLRRGARRVAVIPNWADGDAITPRPDVGGALRQELAWGDSLVVLYSGNMGLAHRFDAVVEAASTLATEQQETLFAFVGGGPRRLELESAAKKLPNVRVYDYWPRDRLNELYNAADIHLVSLREEVGGLLVPSKYAAALAAGKPVLLMGGKGSDLHEEILRSGHGWACAHDPQELTAVLDQAASDLPAVRTKGRKAREVFESGYSRTETGRRWAAILEEVAAGSGKSVGADA